MLEWTYITNRIFQDNLFNENNNLEHHDDHQCFAYIISLLKIILH